MKSWLITLVGALALVWNSGGAFDYYMMQTENADYMAELTDAQRAYFQSFPIWVEFAWAVAIWFSVLGSILLILRSALAPVVFAISFFAMIISIGRNMLLADPTLQEVNGDMALIFSAVIFVIALFLWLFSRQMRIKGMLS